MSEARDRDRYSYADYLAFPSEERFELIEGVAYGMSPAPSRRHQSIVAELSVEIGSQVRGGPCDFYPAPIDVKLSPDEEDDAPTIVEPDLVVVCDPQKLTDRGISGAPDLIIEIVSPQSGMHDRGRKYELYERAGVREYWIVDPMEALVEVYRHDGGNSFVRAGVFGPQDKLECEAVPVVVVDLSRVFENAKN